MKKRVSRIVLSLILTLCLTLSMLPWPALAAVGDLLDNDPAENESILSQMENFSGESYEEAYALLDSLDLLDEDGKLVTDQVIVLDGVEYTLEEIEARLNDPATDLTEVAQVDGVPIALGDLKTIIAIEQELQYLQEKYFTGATFEGEAQDNLNSLMTQLQTEGMTLSASNSAENQIVFDTSNVQEVSAPTDTPSPRTRLTEYPGNPLKNVMESLIPLIDENSDVVGQLTIPGVLEEVVVQRNNTYYLTHNYRGSSSDAGAVFVDESCSLRSPPENLLLRGQGTIEGKVFAPLWQYATAGRDFVASATTAHLTTLYEEADYVLFAVIRASSNPSSPDYFNYAGYSSFATDADMLSYIETARTHSLYSFNVDVTASDRLLTLATLGSGNESLVLLFRQMR